MSPASLTLRRPDDWHLHVRDGAVLQTVLPFTARQFGRAIIMPNLKPPIIRKEMAAAYRDRILAAVPKGLRFTPLMTLYLTDEVSVEDLRAGHKEGIYTAAKLYPANATTNSAHGVKAIKNIHPALRVMEEIGMPLLVHGEDTGADVDVFDREKVFIEKTLIQLLKDFPGLKVVMEHITTLEGAQFVRENAKKYKLGATITPHHLHINRNALFQGGIRPHFYCLPVAKREQHRQALVEAATSGAACFFLGTDSAPHPASTKENDCGCAGIFCAPNALELYAEIFDQQNALDRFEAFASLNGANFYGLPIHEEKVTLLREDVDEPGVLPLPGDDRLVPFALGTKRRWKFKQS
jgi:dihydroorotase